MSHDTMSAAALAGEDTLDASERIWLVGLAHLSDAPSSPRPSSAEVEELLGMAQRLTQFPAGPVAYVPGGFEQTATEDYRLVQLVVPAQPHLRMLVGVGADGFIGVALTRSGVAADGSQRPHAVLVADAESVLADTYTLAVTSAVRLGYRGPIDVRFAVSGAGPGSRPEFFAIDPESGALVRTTARTTPLPPLRHRLEFTDSSTAAALHDDLVALAHRFAQGVGASGPQLVAHSPSDHAVYDADPIGRAVHETRGAH